MSERILNFSISSAENIFQIGLKVRDTPGLTLTSFLVTSNPKILSDNLVIGVIFQTTSLAMELMGSFRDLLIMCVSFALSHRFQQVNKVLLSHKGKSLPSRSFWSEQRENHRRLVRLVDDVDDDLANLNLLALTNNLFSIGVSLLFSLM